MMARLRSLLPEFGPQALSNTVWALARFGLKDRKILKQMADATVARMTHPVQHVFKAQELANTVWAFATLQYRHTPLSEAIAHASAATIDDFSSQNLSNTSWAYAVLSYHNGPLLKEIAATFPR